MESKWMYNNIWKLIGVLLFAYVLIGGMITPLNPGITAVTPDRVKAGESITISCTGYNTHYLQANQNSAWLKLDADHIIEGIATSPIDDNILKADFLIPSSM